LEQNITNSRKKKNLFEAQKLSNGNYGEAAVRFFELSSEELTKWRKKALLKLYRRPFYIIRTLGRLITKPVVLKNYIKAGLNRLSSLLK
jgi:hypothetical protein